MSNVYGSEKYLKYTGERLEWIKKMHLQSIEEREKAYKNYKILLKNYEYFLRDNQSFCSAERVLITVLKDGLKIYETECFDNIAALPYAFEYDNSDYIVFRKSLYGYTTLNLNTLEEYDYFPSAAADGGEAFIIAECQNIENILILDGCYWACPYEIYFLDIKTKKVVHLSDKIDFSNIYDYSITVENNIFTLAYEQKTLAFNKDEIQMWLNSSENYDI